MKKANRLIGLLAAVLLLWPGLAFSQPFEPPEGGPPRFSEGGPDAGPPGEDLSRLSPEQRREQIRKRVELMRMLRLTQELNLDEETATKVFSRLRPIDQKRWKLIQERQRLQRELRDAGESEKSDDRKLQELMKSLSQNRQAMADLDQEEVQALKGLLTPQQQAKYLLFRERFEQEVRDRIRKAQERQEPRPGLGPRGSESQGPEPRRPFRPDRPPR